MLSDDTETEQRVGNRDLADWPTRAGRRLARAGLLLARHVSDHTVFYLTAAVGLVLITVLTAAFAEVYDAVTENEGVEMIDAPVLNTVLGGRRPWLTTVINGFSQLGGPIGMPIIAGLVMVIMAWRWRSRTPVVLLVVGAAGSLLMTTVGKALVGRSRPPLVDAVPPYEYAFSFPSGHALNSTVIAGLIAYLLLRRLRTRRARVLTVVVAAVWALAMGLSRIYLGHHWTTDVLAAWALGGAWLALVITAHRLFLTVRRHREGAGP